MTSVPATITTELIEHTDGRPIAYIDATAVAVFAWQHLDGTYVIDIYTRDDTVTGRLRLLLDGEPMPATSTAHGIGPLAAGEPGPTNDRDLGTSTAAGGTAA